MREPCIQQFAGLRDRRPRRPVRRGGPRWWRFVGSGQSWSGTYIVLRTGSRCEGAACPVLDRRELALFAGRHPKLLVLAPLGSPPALAAIEQGADRVKRRLAWTLGCLVAPPEKAVMRLTAGRHRVDVAAWGA